MSAGRRTVVAGKAGVTGAGEGSDHTARADFTDTMVSGICNIECATGISPDCSGQDEVGVSGITTVTGGSLYAVAGGRRDGLCLSNRGDGRDKAEDQKEKKF